MMSRWVTDKQVRTRRVSRVLCQEKESSKDYWWILNCWAVDEHGNKKKNISTLSWKCHAEAPSWRLQPGATPSMIRCRCSSAQTQPTDAFLTFTKQILKRLIFFPVVITTCLMLMWPLTPGWSRVGVTVAIKKAVRQQTYKPIQHNLF